MSARRILTLANGQGIDLKHPRAEDYGDFTWVAEHLAKEKRYNGATPDVEYSVAEHSARGTQAILEATGDRTLAAYFHLHDVPESVLKDITTPLKDTIDEIAREEFGALAGTVLGTFASVEYRHAAACHGAAGLPFPLPLETRATVKRFDLIMFATEWRDLMRGVPHPDWQRYAHVEPLTGTIEPMAWQDARDVYLALCRELFPALQARAA